MTRLVARLDNLGDVLLAGPAVRAVAASGDDVVFVAGPSGSAAARLLPGVDDVITFAAPWVAFDAPDVDDATLDDLVARVRGIGVEEAIILTSFHQSPLPLALLLRLAGVERIGATCVDYPGRLLDVRHPYLDDLHEVEQALSLCAALGHALPDDDDGRLRIVVPPAGRRVDAADHPTAVVHPGASVPARGLPQAATAELVAALVARQWRVVVTGSHAERDLARSIVGDATDSLVEVATGTTDLVELARLVATADVVVCGNTGLAHLAASVGTPVVEAFAPVVPAHRWRPWGVPHVLLGRLDIDCAGCRARVCPVPGQPCLDTFTAGAALDAIDHLAAGAPRPVHQRLVGT